MKRIRSTVAGCIAGGACAALLTAPAFGQQPTQPVPPPHGLASNSTQPGGGASDALITAKAKAALLAAKGVHSSRIDVGTERGVVTLSGTVSGAEERDRAGRAVQDLDGVVRVNNALKVDGSAAR